MTDRVKGFTVVLSEDVRIDDVQAIKQAIEMIKGVSIVDESLVTPDDFFARARVNSEIRSKLIDFIKKELK